MPRDGVTRRTTARARTSPKGKSISIFIVLRIGIGCRVKMNSPPSAMLPRYETARRVPDCHATTKPFGAAARG